MELKEVKREISSVRNIWKLTGALETLSALKMKKAQKIALLSRPFSEKVAEIIARIDFHSEEESVFVSKRKGKSILALVLASDRGFCGSFNQNILKFAEKTISEIKEQKEVEILPIGKKAIAYFKKKNYKIANGFSGIGDFGEIDDIKIISDFIIDNFIKNKNREVYLFYTNFISTFAQKPRTLRLLPLDGNYLREFCQTDKTSLSEKKIDFLMEPSREELIEEIVPQLVEYLIYQAILEGNASEHSSRMMAMRNASENAEEKVGELNLLYNKARQEQITNEVCEVSSVKEVLE
jgi:F-type H+-transporting ATPase subunit gamma